MTTIEKPIEMIYMKHIIMFPSCLDGVNEQ